MSKITKSLGHSLRNYRNFRGYASRSEFWIWMISVFVFSVIIRVTEGYLYDISLGQYIPDNPDSMVPCQNFITYQCIATNPLQGLLLSHNSPFDTLFLVVLFLPTLALTLRRINSTARRPYWIILFYLVPILNGVLNFIVRDHDHTVYREGTWFLISPITTFVLNPLTDLLAFSLNPVTYLFSLPHLFLSHIFIGNGRIFDTSFLNISSTYFYPVLLFLGAILLVIYTSKTNDESELDESWQPTPASTFFPTPDKTLVKDQIPTPQTTPEKVESDLLQSNISPTCTNCGDTSPNEATHCISCGNKLPPLICPKCQTENISRAKFCMGCGQER